MFSELLLWISLVKNHGIMILDKILQWLIMLWDWFFNLFSVSWSYDFMNVFSKVILGVFIAWLTVFILSQVIKDKKWLKSIIGVEVYNNTTRFMIKGVIFVLGFWTMYFLVTNNVSKILTSVSTIKENWFIVDLNAENLKNDTQVDYKVKETSSFLSSIKYPWVQGTTTKSDDSAKTFYDNMNVVLYKDVNLNGTKIAFSPKSRSGTNSKTLNYKNITISLTEGDKGNLIYGNWTLYFYGLWDFLRKAKENVVCGENEQKINITNLGSDVYSSLVWVEESIKQNKKMQEQLYITTNKISDIFREAQSNQLITTKDNIKDIITEWQNLSLSEKIYQRLAREIICVPKKLSDEGVKKEENAQSVETNNNASDNNWDNKDKKKPSTTLDPKAWVHQAQVDKANSIMEALLFLKKYSSSSVKEMKTKETKFLLLSAIVDATLKTNWGGNGLSFSTDGSQTDAYYELMKINQSDYNALSIPTLVELENGDAIMNYWICSYYVFDQSMERTLKSFGLKHMLQYLNNSCGKPFGWLYDYKNNDIDQLGKSSYQKWVQFIMDGKLASSGKDATLEDGDNAYIKYGFYQRWSAKELQNVYDYVTVADEEIIGEAFAETYQNQVSKFSSMVSFLSGYKVFMFSLFMYLIPGILLAYLLKIVRF